MSGKFVSQAPPSDKATPQVLPQALERIDRPKPESRPEQEYKSPVKGGGILLDLPAPYSDTQK